MFDRTDVKPEAGMPAGGAAFIQLQFSTRELPARDRLTVWREEFVRRMLCLDIEPLSNLPFHAEATLRALPGLRTVNCRGTAARFQRTPAMAGDGEEAIGFVVNLGKWGAASQGGRDVVLGSGDAMPLLSYRPSAFDGTSHLGVLVPRAALASHLKDIDDVAMRPIPRRTESLRLLTGYLRLIGRNLGLTTPETQGVVVGHVHDLVALAITRRARIGECNVSAVAAARLSVALEEIARRFDEPGFGVAAVAQRQGISPRYLQRLIETTGTSFTARVTALRLQRAFTLLTETGDGKARISDLALQAGFSDISQFNRLFRSRFGDTPSGVRGHARRAR